MQGDDADPGSVRKLSPLTDRLELFDTDHILAAGIDIRHAPGHTPGSVVVVVSSGDERAMLLGDIAHCPAEPSLPKGPVDGRTVGQRSGNPRCPPSTL